MEKTLVEPDVSQSRQMTSGIRPFDGCSNPGASIRHSYERRRRRHAHTKERTPRFRGTAVRPCAPDASVQAPAENPNSRSCSSHTRLCTRMSRATERSAGSPWPV